ncbi:MAG: hypothetical protein IPM92_16005 [Saprospiraceae bacterium]|nr:hypothetical protein [Saprospiraceae bacterium]
MNRSEIFYQKLAYLFYAVADADGNVEKQELDKLHEEVLRIWKSLDDGVDEFNTDLSFEIEAVFEWLDENQFSYKDAYTEFKDYALEHKSLFDEDIKKRIMHTARELAAVYRKINHLEENLLHDLENFLHKL